MTSARRGQPPHPMRLSVVGPSALPDLPPISALFLIDFDVKAGYTIAWKQAVPGLELEGVVEYKSLPSGLHTVKDDLIYFIHEAGHAGLSAFINVPCDEADARNARMLAVGVLVPLSFGRLGRAWRYAERLKDMAAKLAADRKQTSILDAYWEQCKPNPNAEPVTSRGETPIASPVVEVHSPRLAGKNHSRDRSVSDGTAAFQGAHTLSQYHPARSLETLLNIFGPLVFPIHRAAVLRKRILISCHAPVHETCNFVYDLSVLSNIPQGLADLLPPQAPTHRLRPLFTIGVHDIPALMEEAARSKQQQEHRDGDDDATLGDETPGGWIACTTDSILAMKDTLWDVLITMPPPFSTNAAGKVWPTVECPGGQPIKATQRDLRRFRALKSGLVRLAAATGPTLTPPSPNSRPSVETRPSTGGTTLIDDESDEALDKIVQPPTWSELAYGGFMWWASAGEQHRPYEHDEAAHDASLLADWIPSPITPPSMPAPSPRVSREHMVDSVASLGPRRRSISGSDDEARAELAIIAFFHRLTTDILSVVGDAVDAEGTPYEDDESESEGSQVRLLPRGTGLAPSRPVRIDSAAFEAMGLDVWNTADAEFIKELAELYYGRPAQIEGKGVEVCGLRVC